jgi:hypothetical protein
MNGDPFSNYQNNPLAAIPTYSLDQSFRHESRELDPFDRAWFAQMATATALALREGRTSVVSSNRAAVVKRRGASGGLIPHPRAGDLRLLSRDSSLGRAPSNLSASA